jgi:ketosteroid isomerase-like protein
MSISRRVSRRTLAAAGALAVVAATTRVHAESADEAAVAKAVADLTTAMLTADKAQLAALVADQLSYGHSGGVVQDKADFIGVIDSKKTVYKSINLTDIKVNVVGNNAIVRHTWDSVSESDGKSNTAHIGVLQVWAKQDGQWKLLARQAFKT